MTAIEEIVSGLQEILESTGNLVLPFEDLSAIPAEVLSCYVLDVDRIVIANDLSGTRDMAVTIRVTSFVRDNTEASGRRPAWVLAAGGEAAIQADHLLGDLLTVPMTLDAQAVDSSLSGTRATAIHSRYNCTIRIESNTLNVWNS